MCQWIADQRRSHLLQAGYRHANIGMSQLSPPSTSVQLQSGVNSISCQYTSYWLRVLTTNICLWYSGAYRLRKNSGQKTHDSEPRDGHSTPRFQTRPETVCPCRRIHLRGSNPNSVPWLDLRVIMRNEDQFAHEKNSSPTTERYRAFICRLVCALSRMN